ncbi:hypothetical protein [Pseudomonas sp. RIT411]|jgi:hypothetical protein|nr:hypothetical protein [Pseudomonas sp. RIT 411]
MGIYWLLILLAHLHNLLGLRSQRSVRLSCDWLGDVEGQGDD